jgi:hypothetical protein
MVAASSTPRPSRWSSVLGAGFIGDSSLVGYDGGQDVRDEERSVEPEQKPRERSFIRELVPDWRPTREQRLWTVRTVIVIVLLLGILTLVGLPFGITLWEWLKLLIVPAVIAAGGLWFNRQQRGREMEIAEQRTKDEALQAYLDQMSQLLTDKERPLHKARPGDNLRTVARARTLTVLSRLDGGRKRSVLEFLYGSGLIEQEQAHLDESNLIKRRQSIVSLNKADLSEANLSKAILPEAKLSGANLSGADLRWAVLRWAGGWTDDQLSAARSLEGATMPNGQKYEDWLKSNGSGEDGENGGPS